MNIISNMSHRDLNTKQLQAYASLCLRDYCKLLKINHAEIDKLVVHLFGILISDNLPVWEQAGACLTIPGRGDPIPECVENIIPVQNLDSFRDLVEYSIEVGIIDMYGASTDLPLVFLEKCLIILGEFQIKPPVVNYISRFGKNDDVWGSVLSSEEYRALAKYYDIEIKN